jgi:hypothetical protein
MQEASKAPARKDSDASQSSIDAANAAQFVRHLEEDPLIHPDQAVGGLAVGAHHRDNLTDGLRACASPRKAEHDVQLPLMTEAVRARIVSILWANWEVRLCIQTLSASACMLSGKVAI